jgi:hypothetical protein
MPCKPRSRKCSFRASHTEYSSGPATVASATQVPTTPAKRRGPESGAKLFIRPVSRSMARVTTEIPTGSRRPTGPFTRTARATASQKRSPAFRPEASPARNASNADRAIQIRQQRRASVWLQRALSQNMYAVQSTNPARAAVRGPARRAPRRNVRATVARPAKADGRRAVQGVTSPVTRDRSAMSQKKSGGLSGVTSPLTCGTIHFPSTTISRAPSAK